MIRYPSGAYGFQILFRLHGSAVFKSLMPAVLSSIIYLVLLYTLNLRADADRILDHPYTMGALVAAFTFLLSFKANFSYNRYWEAFTSVHQMHSKWMDAGMDLAAWHLQSAKFDNIRPPSFGENPHLTSLERARERNEATFEEIENQIDEALEKENENHNESMASRFSRWRLRRRRKGTSMKKNQTGSFKRKESLERVVQGTKKSINAPAVKKPKGDKKRSKKTHERGQLRMSCVTSNSMQRLDGGMADEKSLFLQEAAHLLSLLSAVAMSTLRNDLENAESPLIPYEPGMPFPSVDPDSMRADVREGWGEAQATLQFSTLRYLLGSSRNEANRAIYNAARPLRVYGGVSDAEIGMLQAARGPLAKVALCTMWLEEFVSREHLAGSTGKVAPPIVSRFYQFISDGCLGYNQARKVAYIPFPFPHAQITVLFVLIIVGFIPVLMLSYVDSIVFGFILNLLTVMCFAGLHEVSRELEDPFRNAPNDLPVNNFHSQFNEALMSMFAGYHPDAYWEVKEITLPTLPLEDINAASVSSVPSVPSSEKEVENGDDGEENESESEDKNASDKNDDQKDDASKFQATEAAETNGSVELTEAKGS